eukprot:CAMPEP_0113959154 /NCGR_PEP_ID=MMETSP0011_2-20120614/3978_1 /TAXON_ID=101924 /ORGANISM="Rhodosorus marinus" /LENGTH=453 /DNA_ID=CAMNT_0000970417 /DNA_START=274 /DNA_END=1635 /DNA_ORIENTATION=- /assembly_acc=CAM_ASM_000156
MGAIAVGPRGSASSREKTTEQAEGPLKMLVPGDVVMAKMVGYPWWPSVVESEDLIPEDIQDERPEDSEDETLLPVRFLGDKSYAWLPVSALIPFSSEHQKSMKNSFKNRRNASKKLFLKGLSEASVLLRKQKHGSIEEPENKNSRSPPLRLHSIASEAESEECGTPEDGETGSCRADDRVGAVLEGLSTTSAGAKQSGCSAPPSDQPKKRFNSGTVRRSIEAGSTAQVTETLMKTVVMDKVPGQGKSRATTLEETKYSNSRKRGSRNRKTKDEGAEAKAKSKRKRSPTHEMRKTESKGSDKSISADASEANATEHPDFSSTSNSYVSTIGELPRENNSEDAFVPGSGALVGSAKLAERGEYREQYTGANSSKARESVVTPPFQRSERKSELRALSEVSPPLKSERTDARILNQSFGESSELSNSSEQLRLSSGADAMLMREEDVAFLLVNLRN